MLQIVKGNRSDKKQKGNCVEKYTCDHRHSEGSSGAKHLGPESWVDPKKVLN